MSGEKTLPPNPQKSGFYKIVRLLQILLHKNPTSQQEKTDSLAFELQNTTDISYREWRKYLNRN